MENNTALVQIRSGNSPKIGTKIFLNEFEAICIDRKDNFFILEFNERPIAIFNKIGHIPLPPYIKRIDEDIDKLRYATVYENKELMLKSPIFTNFVFCKMEVVTSQLK